MKNTLKKITQNKRFENILRFLLGIGCIFLVQNIIYHAPVQKNDITSRINEITRILEDNYYETGNINTGKMQDSALKSYVDGLDDPYTVYLDSSTNSGFQETIKGQQDFEGIGAVVSKKDYYVLVEELIKGSPAFKAGLFPLDRIVMIGTGSVKDLTINEAVSRIRGPKGSTVTLMIERMHKDGSKELIKKEVTRDKLSIPSVTSKIIERNGKSFAHITISIIGEETENILKQEIASIKKNHIDGVIVDLRGNGGGLLPISVEIASHFIPKDKLVVSSKYKQLGEENFYSDGFGDLENIPTVVLVDEMSASASEIIALALQEQIGAKIIGKKTFGKGTIQTMFEFSNGTSLKYTIGKRYSPSGKNINKTGILPDIAVDFDVESYRKNGKDSQLEKAISTLENKR
ncbi:MAG: S41 family peptidase [Candidatus Absconditabacteria bacterium]